MACLVALIIFGFLWNRWEDERSLREACRLLRRLGGADLKPSPEPPSPHQLLGDVARPLASSLRGGRSAMRAFRSLRAN